LLAVKILVHLQARSALPDNVAFGIYARFAKEKEPHALNNLSFYFDRREAFPFIPRVWQQKEPALRPAKRPAKAGACLRNFFQEGWYMP